MWISHEALRNHKRPRVLLVEFQDILVTVVQSHLVLRLIKLLCHPLVGKDGSYWVSHQVHKITYNAYEALFKHPLWVARLSQAIAHILDHSVLARLYVSFNPWLQLCQAFLMLASIEVGVWIVEVAERIADACNSRMLCEDAPKHGAVTPRASDNKDNFTLCGARGNHE